MQHTVELVTPEIAEAYLKRNIVNRPVRPAAVKKLADKIRRGVFRTTHQGIAFTTGDRLLDGQHRLLAIIACGIAVRLDVARGVPEDVFDAMDQGQVRNMTDIYGVNKDEAAIATFIAQIAFGAAVAMDRQNAVYLALRSDIDAVKACITRQRLFSTAPIAAAAVVAIQQMCGREYVLNTLKDLSHWNLADLPPVASSFIRYKQKIGSTAPTGISPRSEEFVRALSVFDPRSANFVKVQIKNGPARLEAIRADLLKRLEKTETVLSIVA